MKERIAVICPGRGSYTKESLGYLKSSRFRDFIDDIDQRRRALNEPTISELDSAATFQPSVHTKGEHASALIYACSYADFLAINRDKYDIVAVTGNSMGWYIAQACAGALAWAGAFAVINTMGSMMKEQIIGGQIIYPVVNEAWLADAKKMQDVQANLNDVNGQPGCEAYISIRLGGYVVIGGNPPALAALLKRLPKVENYPFQLINHAAFHTPLLKSTSVRAFDLLPESLFQRPTVPLIDGRGHIWTAMNTDTEAMYRYTLDDQVVTPYDFTRAVTVTLKEFAPDRVVLLGPGNSLGGSLGQILIENKWLGLSSKDEFSERQKQDPFLLSLGLPGPRAQVLL